MDNVVTGTVIGANRYNVDGTKGGNVWLMQPVAADNENAVGNEVMKLACPYELVEKLRASTLPAEYEILVDLGRGANNATRLRCKSLRPVLPVQGKTQATAK